jgi:hypothetical protein
MTGRGGDVPPGWDANPTAWRKRLAIAALATAGLLVSGYLSLYQVGVLGRVWDPFFPAGVVDVLELTRPVPDAAFGVAAYAAELALSFVGGADRWRTRPWTVLAFGVVIACGAVTSIALMAIQPLVAGGWCTPCLASAVISLLIFGWGADEPLAALQHLARVRASGGSAWRALRGVEPLAQAPLRSEA